MKPGDHVIPLYIPECGTCRYCQSGKTNLCITLRATQGQGVMPDGTSRLSRSGKSIHHYMGTSTFAECTVLPEIALARIRDDAPFSRQLDDAPFELPALRADSPRGPQPGRHLT